MVAGASRSFWDLIRNSGGPYESTIAGASMEPTLSHGTRIQIQPLAPDSYRVGQVVACVLKDELFAHRVVHSGAGAVITRGDNRVLCDPPTARAAILGEVTRRSSDGAWIGLGPAPPSRSPGITRANLAIIRGCMGVHFHFARAVAGTTLHIGRFFRLARAISTPKR